MRALVTGATGFVGGALCAELKRTGAFVRAAVRRNAGVHADEIKVVDDFERMPDWTDAVKDIDVVFHVAALAHVPARAARRRLQTINVDATDALARAAQASQVKRFVFLSSLKVNGESSPRAFRESDPPEPRDAYGEAKAAAEERVRSSGVSYTIVRAPLVYGPGVRANFLSLMRAVDRRIPLPLGRVRNQRSLVHVTNLCDAMIFLAKNPQAVNQTFLVADGEDVSTPDLIRRIAVALGKQPRILAFPVSALRSAAWIAGRAHTLEKLIGNASVDTTALRRLGWKPRLTMQQGLESTAAWYRGRPPD